LRRLKAEVDRLREDRNAWRAMCVRIISSLCDKCRALLHNQK